MPETVPVQIAADAAARVDELGMRREMDQMIEHAIKTAPGLRCIRVSLGVDDPHPALGPLVVIEVYRHPPPGGADKTDWGWSEWKAHTFSSEVCMYLMMWSRYREPPDGR